MEKPQQDLSKLVWPEPPNIPRVRYTNYFAGMKFDKDVDTQGKKPKQSWMDRLAGSQSQDEKITVKNFPYQLLGPYGMSVDSKGRLYVADQKVGAIFIFNTETKDTEMIRNGFEAHFGLINGVAVDDDDRIFVSDGKLGKVLVFDAKHKVVDQIKDMVDPVGLAIDKENRLLYVVDTQQDQVLVYDADTLKPIRKIGTAGKKHTLTTPGDFALPTDVAVDKDGNIYVTDTLNWRVEIFDGEGKYISQFGKHCDAIGCFERPKGIAVDADGHIWVVDTSLGLVQAYDRDGALLGYVGGPGAPPGTVQRPDGNLHRPEQSHVRLRAISVGTGTRVPLYHRRRSRAAKEGESRQSPDEAGRSYPASRNSSDGGSQSRSEEVAAGPRPRRRRRVVRASASGSPRPERDFLPVLCAGLCRNLCRPYGTRSHFPLYPALKRWAKIFRPIRS